MGKRKRNHPPLLTLHPSRHSHSIELDKDLLTVKYTGKGMHGEDFGTIQSDEPMPRSSFVSYFEVTILNARHKSGISVGVGSKKVGLSKQIGVDKYGYALNCGRGHLFHQSEDGTKYTSAFQQGDVLGCGIHWANREVFFTRNGNNLGTAFRNVKCNKSLFAYIGLHVEDERVRANFGQSPFMFDLKTHIEACETEITDLLGAIPVEKVQVQMIVEQFLEFNGFKDTLAALKSDLCYNVLLQPKDGVYSAAGRPKKGREEGQPEGTGPSSQDPRPEDTARYLAYQAELQDTLDERAEIRSLIMSKKPLKAMAIAKKEFPKVFKQPKHRFPFHQLHFVELIRNKDAAAALQYAAKHLKSEEGMSTKGCGDVLHVLAYSSPIEEPAVAHFFKQSFREQVADVVNLAILQHSLNPGPVDPPALDRIVTHLGELHSKWLQKVYGRTPEQAPPSDNLELFPMGRFG